MHTFLSKLQQFNARLAASFRRFMSGRYGTDRLNIVLLFAALICSILSAVLGGSMAAVIFWLLCYGLMFWAIFRCLSKNTYKRYQENRQFLMIFDRLKDRQNRYYTCPKCRQTVRVPRGKGKIAITCPRCKERFIKKT